MFVTLRNSLRTVPPADVRERFTVKELLEYRRLGDSTLVSLSLGTTAAAAAITGVAMGEVVASLPAAGLAAYNLGRVVVNTAMSYWMEINAQDRTSQVE